MLFAEMSFVNEPGKFRLEIKFKRGGSERTVWLEFFVASTKMDVKGDYKRILEIFKKYKLELQKPSVDEVAVWIEKAQA